jgi:hypothetical protein
MPTSPVRSRRSGSGRRVKRAGIALLGTAALTLSMALVPSAAGASDIPPVDEVVTSDNIEHLANVPLP